VKEVSVYACDAIGKIEKVQNSALVRNNFIIDRPCFGEAFVIIR